MQESCHTNTSLMPSINVYLVQRSIASHNHTEIMKFSTFLSEFPSEFRLHLEANTFLLDMRPQTPRTPFPYRTTSEHTTEYFHDGQHQVLYAHHSQIHRTTFCPHSHSVSRRPTPTPTSTTVLAHIHAPCRSTRVRVTITGRRKLRDIVRKVLGHTSESHCVVSIKKRGAWRDIGFEVVIENSEHEVEIRILATVEERGERCPRLDWESDSAEAALVDRWT